MTKIDLHIDTEDAATVERPQPLRPMAGHKVGLLSTIPISPAQLDAFANGYGTPSSNIAKADNLTYGRNAIRQGKKKLKNIDRCAVIAVTGGLAAFNAIFSEADNPPFVCLVGMVPPPAELGNCSGGISTNGWRSNKDKFDYLKGKLGYNANEIGLYYNPNSGVQADEVADWNSFNPGTVKPFSGAQGIGGPTPTNDPSKFGPDFTGSLLAGLKAVVISADPFFQASMEKLIVAANSWSGYVCFPLQDYKNVDGTPPQANKSVLYGPDLTVAYAVLGALAQGAVANPDQGFFIASNLITPL